MSDPLTRRELIDRTGRAALTAALAGAAGTVLPPGPLHAAPTTQQSPRPTPPGEKIVMGLIGCGGQGRSNMNELLDRGAEFAVVCDVDTRRMVQAAALAEKKQGRAPVQIQDFRRLLERKDIQAVVIATPDHWHALPTILACEAGKDIHVEKPLSHNIAEGRAMVAAAQHHRRIVQVGTWQRSRKIFVDAIDFIRAGRLGKVVSIRAWKVDTYKMGRQQPTPPPPELDYDFWVGPAQFEPYQENRCHFHFRWYFNYAAGMTGDWGVHLMDIALLAMSRDTDLVMPVEVSSVGGKLGCGAEDDRTTPDTQVALYRFKNPDFLLQWEIGSRSPVGGPEHGVEFTSAEGNSLLIWRGGWVVRDAKGNEIPKTEKADFGHYDHMLDWLECIKERRPPRSSIASLYQTTVVCHLGNIAYLTGETIRWDKAKNDLVGKAGRSTILYQREYRRHTKAGDWKLPAYKI